MCLLKKQIFWKNPEFILKSKLILFLFIMKDYSDF